MKEKKDGEQKSRYVYVKDPEGVEYVCRFEDLKRTDELSEEEKERCMKPQGGA